MNKNLFFQNNLPNSILLMASYPQGNKETANKKDSTESEEMPLPYLFRDGYQWVMRDQRSVRRRPFGSV